MNASEINAAIAESQGIVSRNQHGKLYHTDEGYVVDCPNYHGSLDAIVPVIRAMSMGEQHQIICVASKNTNEPKEWYCAFSTPAQWCEAYLKAINLWK